MPKVLQHFSAMARLCSPSKRVYYDQDGTNYDDYDDVDDGQIFSCDKLIKTKLTMNTETKYTT